MENKVLDLIRKLMGADVICEGNLFINGSLVNKDLPLEKVGIYYAPEEGGWQYGNVTQEEGYPLDKKYTEVEGTDYDVVNIDEATLVYVLDALRGALGNIGLNVTVVKGTYCFSTVSIVNDKDVWAF